MQHRVAPEPNIIAAGQLFRGIVHALIRRETDPAERKARIMIAFEHGHLTADEAEEWIVLGGLGEA